MSGFLARCSLPLLFRLLTSEFEFPLSGFSLFFFFEFPLQLLDAFILLKNNVNQLFFGFFDEDQVAVSHIPTNGQSRNSLWLL